MDGKSKSGNRRITDRGSEIVLRGTDLTIEDAVRVARFGTPVSITEDPSVLERVAASHDYIVEAVKNGSAIYGVTTGFGGMAGTIISTSDASELQENLLWFMKSETGRLLAVEDVRAAMLIRANTHLLGLSGLRLQLVQRMVDFLNAGATPLVREFGSIGASGDLTPLACITGALIGLDRAFQVDLEGKTIDAVTALKQLGLEPIRLAPKEGLAMINGTAVMTGVAGNCLYDTMHLFGLALGAHALMIQALQGSNQSFHPFLHDYKPHPGQRWAASAILELLHGSAIIRDELEGRRKRPEGELIQDRYSLRCLPQFLGPIVDGLRQIREQITVEMNSATDNPLIDAESGQDFHGGNFLGQYVGVAMDQLRYFVGLTAKHLDAQISLLVYPEFSNGLPPSLVGNPERKVNMGLKGLQIDANSIMPVLSFLGNSLVDRFPTHAEQFNQNINSQGLGSANLARQSVDTFRRYIAIALMFGVQAIDLRTRVAEGHFDARKTLSPATRRLYLAVKDVVGSVPSADRPYVRNDNEQVLSEHIQLITEDIAGHGRVPASLPDWLVRME
jgi:phenylalanine ammonia-lyase